jgi:CHAD domain-containing protein
MKGYEFKWDETAAVAHNARGTLPMASQQYFKAGRETFGAKATPAALHAFRLQTKRFRYSLELFRPIYGPALERMIDSLRRIQQVLGEINDCEAARELALANGGRRSPEVRRLVQMLNRRQAEKTAELARFWLEFDREGVSRRWLNYLAVYPGRVRRSRPA